MFSVRDISSILKFQGHLEVEGSASLSQPLPPIQDCPRVLMEDMKKGCTRPSMCSNHSTILPRIRPVNHVFFEISRSVLGMPCDLPREVEQTYSTVGYPVCTTKKGFSSGLKKPLAIRLEAIAQ